MEIRIKIEDDMSKAQEEAILEKLHRAFQMCPNNYLSSLFSQEFVGWANNRVNDDFPLDVMDYVNAWTEARDVWEKLERAKEHIAHQNVTIDSQDIRLRESACLCDQRDTDLEKLRALMDLQEEAMRDLVPRSEVVARDERIEDLLDQLLRLKAKLFDLSDRKNL